MRRGKCKHGWTDRFGVSVVRSSGPKDALSSIVFAMWRQCVLMGRLCRHLSNNNEPSVYGGDARNVKLLWPHLIFENAHLVSGTDSLALRAEYCIVGIPHNTAIHSFYLLSSFSFLTQYQYWLNSLNSFSFLYGSINAKLVAAQSVLGILNELRFYVPLDTK